MKIKKEQLEPYIEQLTSWKLGKEYDKAVYCHPVLFNLYEQYIMWNAGLDESQAGIIRYADDTTRMEESEEELKSLLMREKEEDDKLAWNSTFKKLRSWHPVPSLLDK